MKITLEIPDSLICRAKARAAELGMPFRRFVTEAVEAKLTGGAPGRKPWMKMVGGLRHLRTETSRINLLIEKEFERIGD
jgi:hypothetical protein